MKINGKMDIIKVGIGSGAVCTTRLQTGVGMPQSFILTVTDNVDRFRIYNPDETSATSFTLKLTQNSTGGYGVGINTIHNGDDDAVAVYWPGGVVPEVTTTASKSDIYSFNIYKVNR